MNPSHADVVLHVLWRAHETAQAVEDLLTTSSTPPGVEVRVVTSLELAEAQKDWPLVLVDGNPSETLLSGASLTTVVVPYAGVGEKLRAAAASRPHLRVRNSHYNARMVAQHATALLLGIANRIVASDAALRVGDWGDKTASTRLGVDLAGKRALLLGHGSIGQAPAPTLASLGMNLTAFTRSGTAADGLPAVGPDTWRSALPAADVVICSLPATERTLGLVGAAELAALPDRAIVVNVGRGPVIDEDALFTALESGRLYGAGLDVWYRYPADREARRATLPSTRPFHTLDNVVMSPHRADEVDGWRLRAASDVMLTLRDVRAGGRRNLVDLERGY